MTSPPVLELVNATVIKADRSVLDGVMLTIQAGEQRFELEAGGAAVVPMSVSHTFRVDSETATWRVRR